MSARDTHRVRRVLLLVCTVTLTAAGCGGDEDKPDEPLPGARASLTLRSPAFREGGTIPRDYTCDGAGVSPPLSWSGVPRNTRELDLVVEDPDANRFVHWTLLRIPPKVTAVEEGRIPAGAIELKNSFGDRGWGAPCPPEGDDPHRYVFALYATGAPLGLGAEASADDVRNALKSHAIARGTLTGRFGR